MKLHSYICVDDTGFSPNPFWGYCTLANCKPAIRRTASVGDWIVGLSPKKNGNRIIYAMQVDEVLPYADYYEDSRFAEKIPNFKKGKLVHKLGDNIFKPLPNRKFQQLRSMHSNKEKARDLSGINVLISQKFHYFGSQALALPEKLFDLKVGRSYKNKFSPEVASRFVQFINEHPHGIIARPSKWSRNDNSWLLGKSSRFGQTLAD